MSFILINPMDLIVLKASSVFDLGPRSIGFSKLKLKMHSCAHKSIALVYLLKGLSYDDFYFTFDTVNTSILTLENDQRTSSTTLHSAPTVIQYHSKSTRWQSFLSQYEHCVIHSL